MVFFTAPTHISRATHRPPLPVGGQRHHQRQQRGRHRPLCHRTKADQRHDPRGKSGAQPAAGERRGTARECGTWSAGVLAGMCSRSAWLSIHSALKGGCFHCSFCDVILRTCGSWWSQPTGSVFPLHGTNTVSNGRTTLLVDYPNRRMGQRTCAMQMWYTVSILVVPSTGHHLPEDQCGDRDEENQQRRILGAGQGGV